MLISSTTTPNLYWTFNNYNFVATDTKFNINLDGQITR